MKLTVIFLLLSTVIATLGIKLLEARSQAHYWEEKFRDCQASMWMRDPYWLESN